MKSLGKFVKEINKSARHYKTGQLQEIRRELKKKRRLPSHNVFQYDPDHPSYVFHWGGRSELQFNIGFMNKDTLRYGIAFNSKKDHTLTDRTSLDPKIRRLKEYIHNHPSDFRDLKFLIYDEDTGRNVYQGKVREITERMIGDLTSRDMFYFWGRFKQRDKIRPEDVLRLFDRLLPAYEYVEGDAARTKPQGKPQFVAGLSVSDSEKARVPSKREARENDLKHNRLIKKVIPFLEKNVGNVGHFIGGSPIDIVVRSKEGYRFYEIKTGGDIKYCIREALGQLLEYSYWPGSEEAKHLFIVTTNKLDREASQYLKTLRKQFHLPVYHQTLNEKSGVLEEE